MMEQMVPLQVTRVGILMNGYSHPPVALVQLYIDGTTEHTPAGRDNYTCG